MSRLSRRVSVGAVVSPENPGSPIHPKMKIFRSACLPRACSFVLLSVFGFVAPPARGDDSIAVLEGEAAPALEADSRGMLNAWLAGEVDAALDRRLEKVEALVDDGDVEAYQEELREIFVDALGGFPERTPLRARVTGEVAGDGYRVEKILYHSRPGFPVTANLYLPEGPGPHPGVLHSCGHSADGKGAEFYQIASALLARHGIAVLCVDPLGQGERKQLGAEGVTGSTNEHMLMGVAPVLLGQDLATTMIWDGIRGLDYLASRSEIDADRLGCVGNSGGGMMTSYLMALDPRVRAAAPACFITDTRRKNRSPGPGDAEQNLFAQTARGLDHADFLLMRAPRPTLILSATQDYVPIEGAWDSFRQAKRVYGQLGFPERVDLAEVNERHGFSPGLRVAAVRWMSRWLLDRDEALEEPDLEALAPETLHVTPTGSVLDLEGGRSYFDLMSEEAATLAQARSERRADAPDDAAARETLVGEVRDVLGLPLSADLTAAEVRSFGQAERDGIRWEKRVFHSEPGIVLPALVAVPEGEPRGAVLRVDGEGKNAALADPKALRDWLERGFLVCLVDLRGYGEIATDPWRYKAVEDAMGPNSAEVFIGYMLGRSLVEMRTGDLLRTALALREELPEGAPLHLVGRGHAAVPALHAAALEGERFARVDVSGGLESWSELCEGPRMDGWQLENAVRGALRVYDLPDLREIVEAR